MSEFGEELEILNEETMMNLEEEIIMKKKHGRRYVSKYKGCHHGKIRDV